MINKANYIIIIIIIMPRCTNMVVSARVMEGRVGREGWGGKGGVQGLFRVQVNSEQVGFEWRPDVSRDLIQNRSTTQKSNRRMSPVWWMRRDFRVIAAACRTVRRCRLTGMTI